MIEDKRRGAPRSELASALASCRHAIITVGFVSAIINILYLTGSFFMLEVYDRVLPSRSVSTLVALVVLAGALYAFQGVLDIARSRILNRVGAFVDEAVSARVFNVTVRLPLRGAGPEGVQPLRDLESVRGFLSGGGPSALFDLPWIPLYVFICFLFHFWIGIAAGMGALLLIAATLLTEIMSRGPTVEASKSWAARLDMAEAGRRNAEVVRAMGMGGPLEARWRSINEQYLSTQMRAADVSSGFGALTKVLRMMLQSGVLAVGAYLVIRQEATAGIIIAGSILSARALAPVELAIANWRSFLGARQGWSRLAKLLASSPEEKAAINLPAPAASLSVETISVAPAGVNRLVVQEAAFAMRAGQGLGIIGPSASGKSSLARALVGVWRPVRGNIRLDGADLDQWGDDLGSHIGYLPQDVELFAGTVSENISRFQPDASSEDIIGAARAAGVHELILRLPDGYRTEIGESGVELSAGQRQRIGLARALFGDPFLVVLDEPNSNLDSEGEQALTAAITGVRARGGIAIVVAHRPSALAAVDQVLVMSGGRQQAFGPKDSILSKLVRPAAVSESERTSVGLRAIGEGISHG